MNIANTKFGGDISEFCSPNVKKLENILDAKWTMCISFYIPIGLKKSLRFTLRSKRARVTVTCEGLLRKVLVDGQILFKNECQNNPILKKETFQNLFEEGNSSFNFDVKLGYPFFFQTPSSIELNGELNFQVSPENYFFYKFQEDYKPSESELEDSRLQIASEIGNDLSALYKKQELADIAVRCESKEIKAHKAILCARSAVFSKMFQTKMKESEDNVINIENMTFTILEDLMEYIYRGKIDSMDDSKAGDLLSAAEEYQLPGLKRACIYYLQSAMSADNALSTLALADLYDENLKNKSIDFICKEFDHIKSTEEWKQFQKERATLANEVLLNIIEFTNLQNWLACNGANELTEK